MMGFVESNAALYTTIMKSGNILDEYYCVFKAQINTIKANGGDPGYHLALAQEHLEAQLVSKGFDTPEKQKLW